MGKNKQSSNSVNVQVGGDATGNTIHAAYTHNAGGTHIDLGEANDPDEITPDQPDATTVALFRALATKFTMEELETMCWELGIVYDDLPAKTLSGKARQLVQKADDLSVTDKLIAIVNRERPDIGIKSLKGI